MEARQLIVTVAAAAVLAPVAFSAAAQVAGAPGAFELPKPTGPFTVGTTTFHLIDQARIDPLADTPEPRQVVVHAWYPAVNAAGGRQAPCLRDGSMEARTFATLLRQPVAALDYLAETRTYGVLDAPPRTGERFPVLLFSLGYTAIRSSYTALLEDLASHGYAVLSVIHPYESMAATLASGSAARLVARLDFGRLGAFGHSMGGVVAADFCARDRRCRAGLNLDGIPQYGSLIDSPPGRPFLMVYSAREGRLGASDVIYKRAAKPYLRVDVADTLHNDFSDMVLWGGPLAGRPMFGKLPATQAVAVTRQIVREYFDQELIGRRSSLLSGRTTVDGVRVH